MHDPCIPLPSYFLRFELELFSISLERVECISNQGDKCGRNSKLVKNEGGAGIFSREGIRPVLHRL